MAGQALVVSPKAPQPNLCLTPIRPRIVRPEASRKPHYTRCGCMVARGSSHVIRLGAFNISIVLPFALYFLSIFSLAAACSCSPLLFYFLISLLLQASTPQSCSLVPSPILLSSHLASRSPPNYHELHSRTEPRAKFSRRPGKARYK
jgi:hypothetical protein